MTSRERIRAIIAGSDNIDRTGFWLGDPMPETLEGYLKHFNLSSEEALRQFLQDDFRWIMAERNDPIYRHPEKKPFFPLNEKTSLGEAGPLAQMTSIEQLEEYEWPKLEYLDLDATINQLMSQGDHYRASGFWTPFYHHLMDLFGMEEYLVKMYTHPQLVHQVTDRICDFYYQANKMLFKRAGSLIDGFFFGNDFGTQLDLIMSPALFREFVMPWMHRFTQLAHDHGYQVILHSCGSIYKVIQDLISIGVDCFHPIQAKAAWMDAENLGKEFGNRVAFLGGVDTQHLLVYGTPSQVRERVMQIKKALGPRVIISPSHEALLPNVPAENVLAMAEAAVNG